jgi:hypothetical protein
MWLKRACGIARGLKSAPLGGKPSPTQQAFYFTPSGLNVFLRSPQTAYFEGMFNFRRVGRWYMGHRFVVKREIYIAFAPSVVIMVKWRVFS